MGYVDRHSRFRQGILGLNRVWKTKRWQTRVQLEIFGVALVNAFLLARKFMPKWHLSLLAYERVFWKFTRTLLPQLNENV